MNHEEYRKYLESIETELLLILREGDYELSVLYGWLMDVPEIVFNDAIDMLCHKKHIRLFEHEVHGRCVSIEPLGKFNLFHNPNLVFNEYGTIFRKQLYNRDSSTRTERTDFDIDKLNQRLNSVASELLRHSFIENVSDFIAVFTTGDAVQCRWTKNHSALLYLLFLMSSKHGSYLSDEVVKLSHDRFIVKDKTKTLKQVQSVASKLRPFLKRTEGELTAQYLTIFNILQKAKQ